MPHVRKGDMVVCPDGSGRYRMGEVAGDYTYARAKCCRIAGLCNGWTYI